MSHTRIQQEFEEHIRPLLRFRPNGYATYVTTSLDDLPPYMRETILSHGKKFEAATFTRSEPNVAVHEHTDDMETRHERYHLPINTPGTVLWEDGVKHVMIEGEWYGPIRYWVPHSVEAVDVERIHLIVDLSVE